MKKSKYGYKGKHQGSNYKWPMSQATKDRKEADKNNSSVQDKIKQALEELKEEKPGLWANINAKKKRGEKASHGNSNAHKDAVKAGKKIKANERVRFLSPEKQKANDAKFEKRMALLKALEKGIELHKAGKISDEDLHNLKLKAGTISADSKFISEDSDYTRAEAIKLKADLKQLKVNHVSAMKKVVDKRGWENPGAVYYSVDFTLKGHEDRATKEEHIEVLKKLNVPEGWSIFWMDSRMYFFKGQDGPTPLQWITSKDLDSTAEPIKE